MVQLCWQDEDVDAGRRRGENDIGGNGVSILERSDKDTDESDPGTGRPRTRNP
jgi:hypothetical protein